MGRIVTAELDTESYAPAKVTSDKLNLQHHMHTSAVSIYPTPYAWLARL